MSNDSLVFSILAGAFMLLLTTVSLAVGSFLFDGPDKPSISERINAACPAGYKVTDWATDGEFTDIPPDTIKVTCVSKDDVRYVAVQR